MRQISATFLSDLKDGKLKNILSFVKRDKTLDLELRGTYVTIYYRGAAILTITEKGPSDYKVDTLSKSYHNGVSIPHKPLTETKEYFPEAKSLIDFYFTRNQEKNKKGKDPWEREIEQLIVRENNYSANAEATDFYILDMEYTDKDSDGRADIVALHWDADGPAHKNPEPKVTLYFIEVKQGEKAITSTKDNPGLASHYADFEKFKRNEKNLAVFKADMLKVFEQKCDLDLIRINKDAIKNSERFKKFTISDFKMAYILANYKYRSTKLCTELKKLKDKDAYFFVSCFMGYGLYSEYMLDVKQIYKLASRI